MGRGLDKMIRHHPWIRSKSTSSFGWVKCQTCKRNFLHGKFTVIFKDVIECRCGQIRITAFGIIEKAFEKHPDIKMLVKKSPTFDRGSIAQKENKVSRIFEDFLVGQALEPKA